MTTPSGPHTSTGSPAAKVPSTPVIPAGSSDLRRVVTAATAPSSSSRRPRAVVACASQRLREARRAAAGANTVPTSCPASASLTSGSRVSSVGMPAAPAIPAASTLVTIPPLPTEDPVPPIVTESRSVVVATNGTRCEPLRDGGPS